MAINASTDVISTSPGVNEIGLSTDQVRREEEHKNRQSRIMNEQTMSEGNLIAFLLALFLGMKDDNGLSSPEALNELAGSLSIDPLIFSNTVNSFRSGNMSISDAVRSTRTNMNSSTADFSRAEAAIAQYAESGNPLLELIADKESGGDYNRVYGAGVQRRDLTNMTINEVLAWQRHYTGTEGSASSAAGKYQIIRKTLEGLKDEMGLTGNEKFDEEMQDRMAYQLLERRGYSDYLAGNMAESTFMRKISQEWASMPKDEGGRSYYAGDGLNKAHATPETLLLAMRHAQDNQLTQERTAQLLAQNGSLSGTFATAQANEDPAQVDPQQPDPLTTAFDGQGVDQTELVASTNANDVNNPAPNVGMGAAV